MTEPVWTVDAVLAHLTARIDEQDRRNDVRFSAQEKAVHSALDSAQRAVAKAEVATEARFASVNEFRAVLTDQAGTFVTRAEADRIHQMQAAKTDGLEARVGAIEGRTAGLSAGWLMLVGLISVGAAIFATISHWG
jgi:hypothetical protein